MQTLVWEPSWLGTNPHAGTTPVHRNHPHAGTTPVWEPPLCGNYPPLQEHTATYIYIYIYI